MYIHTKYPFATIKRWDGRFCLSFRQLFSSETAMEISLVSWSTALSYRACTKIEHRAILSSEQCVQQPGHKYLPEKRGARKTN